MPDPTRRGRTARRHPTRPDGRHRNDRPQARRSSDFYRTAAWRKLRRRHLDAAPLCVDCLADPGVEVPELATELDHLRPLVDRPDLALDPSNLAGRCKRHHSRRTVLEHGGLGRPRPPRAYPQGEGPSDP